ncbi:MAG: TRAP transporter fused permease subunit [Rhodospirillaceae bacterium]|nr:TRAP transporter fused permease subunit [Rhodospirillaceae bacterium]
MAGSAKSAVRRLGAALFAVGARRRPRGLLGQFVKAYCAALAVWVIYSVAFAVLHPWLIAAVFLCAILAAIFVVIGATESSVGNNPGPLDWLLSLLALASGAYLVVNADYMTSRVPQLDELSDLAFAVGVVLFLLSLEATRRTTGLGLAVIAGLFVAYNLLGHRLGGVIAHGYISFVDFIEITVFTTSGIMGSPIRVAATYAFMFVLFGTFLSSFGGGEFFYNLGAVVAGRRVGGPAKVAVVSSGLYGTISGSPVSDVVTTGSITIPMMKRMGYTSTFAAGAEVAASTGGSLMPPVMGAAAFIMVDYTGISYPQIALAAVVPAVLYYLAVYTQVDLRSRRYGLLGLPASAIPSAAATFRTGWVFLIPIAVLVAALIADYSPSLVALMGVAAVLVVAAVFRRWTAFRVRLIYDCLAETSIRIMAAAGACAAAGLVIAGLTMTGLAQKFSHLMNAVTGAELFPTLVLTAAITLVLGCGMPTVSAYILAAVLAAPTLIQMGVPMLAAHMFILYYSSLSAMTPPVAVAAYAAAAISEDNPIAIAVAAVRLGFAAFIVPFAFVYAPSLLLLGDTFSVVATTLLIAAGVLCASRSRLFTRPAHRAGAMGNRRGRPVPILSERLFDAPAARR